jgi:glycosyltransferase involved in cell wall biosynthesis
MIKNEAAIVTRCIESARSVADAVCVCDTGSTDATLDVLDAYLPTLGVPTKVTRTPWVDFGTSRTESMRATVAFCDELEWDQKSTYSLVLDADMVLRVTDAFDKSALRCSSYRMKQQTSRLVYYNIRLMRLSDPWVCVGPTHEYWDCADADATLDSGTVETAYIEDVGDGKCKDDKFERDERLLRAALATDPTNARHMFYLAQTLRDRGDVEGAIEWYQRRVEARGWAQETWYSMYQTAAMYYKLRRMPEMEYWGLKAQEFTGLCGSRAECAYLLARAFRETGQHHKAWHYYELGSRIAKKRPSADALFVEPDVYTRLFEYERTILSYYVLGTAHNAESLRDVVRYMNVHGTSENTWSNMEFYVTRVPSTRVRALSLRPCRCFAPVPRAHDMY